MTEKEIEKKDEVPEEPDDSITIEEFRNLRGKKLSKHRKVDWNAVLDRIDKEPGAVTLMKIKKIATELSTRENVTFYYSEIKRVIEKWERSELVSVQHKVGPTGRGYYLIRKRGEGI